MRAYRDRAIASSSSAELVNRAPGARFWLSIALKAALVGLLPHETQVFEAS